MERGERIGNYRIEKQLETTQVCAVFVAVHQVLPRRAIIKVAHGEATRPLSVQLLREACILEALQHPGIARVYESGRLPDGGAWFASELVEGMAISEAFLQGMLDPVIAAGILRDIADVLAHAHRRGVVHCGLVPARIVVTPHGRGFPLCIADWSAALLHDGRPLGNHEPTPYAAPELVHGDALDDRADVFALGVIAYQALTGTLPFEHVATDSDGSPQHVPTEVRCPEAPRELTALVDQMLALDRWDRPSSAEARGELAWLAETLAPAPPRQLVRIRRPRWTPPIKFGANESRDPEPTEIPKLDS